MKFKNYLNEALDIKLPKKAKTFSYNTRDLAAAGMPSSDMAYVLSKDQNKHDEYERLEKDEVMIYRKDTGKWSQLGVFKKKSAEKDWDIKIR